MRNDTIDREIASDTAETHLDAYNAAFYELGLRWHWDAKIYQDLQRNSGEKDCLQVYLETHQPHLLKAYDVDFLMSAIQTTKTRCHDAMTACGARRAPIIDWSEIQREQVGV